MSSIEEVRGPYPEYQKIRDAARNPRALEHGSFSAPDREGRPRGANGLHDLGSIERLQDLRRIDR